MTSGISAPSTGFPKPSSTRYVGRSSSPPVTELMNFKLETKGDRVLGKCPAELASPRVAHFRATTREIAAKQIIV